MRNTLKKIRPIYVYLLIVICGLLLSLNSYNLGKKSGEHTIKVIDATGDLLYMENDEKKIEKNTDTYRDIGCTLLLIGGIGVVSITNKDT